jgi:hypothetical protein
LAEEYTNKLRKLSLLKQDELSSEKGVDYSKLRELLAARNWKEADHKTYLVMLQAVGRKQDDSLREEELLSFSCTDLRTIDNLWVKYSDGHFGFSIQKEIYLGVGGKADGSYEEAVWKKFCEQIGWRINNNWITGSQVIYNTKKSGYKLGHLPSALSFEDIGLGTLVMKLGGGIVSLTSRLTECDI